MSPDKQRDTIHNRDVHQRPLRPATNRVNARDGNARDASARDASARDGKVNSHMPEPIGPNHCAPGNDTRKIRVGSLRAMPKWRYIELSEIGSTCS